MSEHPDIDLVAATFGETIAVHQQLKRADPGPILQACALMTEALVNGGKVLLFGNGGSAADAQHVAAELVGRFQRERAAWAAIALSADTSVLTSIGNDYSYDREFARQIEALGRQGDVAVGISTSGLSPNVALALDVAKERGLRTIALTGRDGGHAGRIAEVHVNVPVESTARAQEAHRTILHIICDLVERALAGDG